MKASCYILYQWGRPDNQPGMLFICRGRDVTLVRGRNVYKTSESITYWSFWRALYIAHRTHLSKNLTAVYYPCVFIHGVQCKRPSTRTRISLSTFLAPACLEVAWLWVEYMSGLSQRHAELKMPSTAANILLYYTEFYYDVCWNKCFASLCTSSCAGYFDLKCFSNYSASLHTSYQLLFQLATAWKHSRMQITNSKTVGHLQCMFYKTRVSFWKNA